MTVVDFYMYETSKEDMSTQNINYSYQSKTLTVASATVSYTHLA